ncbi:MAG: delta-60 repeat domain-containing protein [Deltaproteobacteria bacterium]|nr:delta-60 repeat domain-containing protein [Deltaproteobacteria bacterium]
MASSSPQDTESTASLLNGSVRAILAQPDGKTVLGGDFHPPNHVARLNSDGSMDAEFEQNIGFAFNAPVHALALDADGGILAGGDFSDFSGMFASRIVRLNPDGTLDNDFRMNLGQGFNDKVSSIAVQGDGKILVAGNFTEFNGVAAVRIARLNEDGTLDSSYGAPAASHVPPDTTPPAAPRSGK